MSRVFAYRKNQGNATPDGFRAIKVSLGADKQLLLALCRLPREDVGTKEEDLDGLARRLARRDAGVVFRHRDLGGWSGGRDRDGGGFLGSFHYRLIEILQVWFVCECLCVEGRLLEIRLGEEGEEGKDGMLR